MDHAGYIDDGYTQDAYLNGKERLHPPLRFKYRPALLEERLAIWDGTGKPLLKICKQGAAQMEKKILEWDLKDRHGADVKITATNLLHLPSDMFLSLQDIVFGFQPCDADPLDASISTEKDDEGNLPSALPTSDQDLKNS